MSSRLPDSIALTAPPTSNGIRTVIPIASQASAREMIKLRRYGRRKPSSRLKVRMLRLYKVK